MTFEEFKTEVRRYYEAAEEGEFENFAHQFAACRYNPGRLYYRWSVGSIAISYDTADAVSERWYACPGRGAAGRGQSLSEALANEEKNYYPQ